MSQLNSHIISRLFLLFSVVILLLMLLATIILGMKKNDARRVEYDYFFEAHSKLPPSHFAINWADQQPIGKTLHDNARFELSKAITLAWKNYAKAMQSRNHIYLLDHFTGTAIERGRHILLSPSSAGSNMVFLGITVEPSLLHLDATLFQLHSEDAIFARYKIDGGHLSYFELSKECITENFLLKGQAWKIAHHERQCARSLPLTPKKSNWHIPPLKGVNYYPKDTPWSAFWQNYDEDIIAADLDRIVALGGNSIRIFLPYWQFLHEEDWEDYIKMLEDFIMAAKARELWVIPTLFDFRGLLEPWSWSDDRIYLERVLTPLKDADNIAYIDLKNELDLDIAYQSEAVIDAWAMTMIGLARDFAPKLRYSIGWSDAKSAHKLTDYLDVISYHDYQDVKAARRNYDAVKKLAGARPVIISEIGETSYSAFMKRPSSIDKQADKLSSRLIRYEEADGVLIWTLYDFERLDEKAISGSFWHKGIQRNFGLFDKDNNIKPAGKIFKEWSVKGE